MPVKSKNCCVSSDIPKFKCRSFFCKLNFLQRTITKYWPRPYRQLTMRQHLTIQSRQFERSVLSSPLLEKCQCLYHVCVLLRASLQGCILDLGQNFIRSQVVEPHQHERPLASAVAGRSIRSYSVDLAQKEANSTASRERVGQSA